MKESIPTFKTDKEAEDFVATADLSDYDLSGGEVVRFELKRKDKSVNLRLPAQLLKAVQEQAKRVGMSYQRFIRMALEIHEALHDISRRPKPDRTGAIQHAIAALECTAREVTGEPNATLGALIPKLNLPKPLDVATEKLWGFASDRTRHMREGKGVSDDEAELIVSVSCAVSAFLSKRPRE
jgi:predicted DNA binding CopG/RHH family protein